jgi:hypothetical protein
MIDRVGSPAVIVGHADDLYVIFWTLREVVC